MDANFVRYVHSNVIHPVSILNKWSLRSDAERNNAVSEADTAKQLIEGGKFIPADGPDGQRILRLLKTHPRAAVALAADKIGVLDRRDNSHQSVKATYSGMLEIVRAELDPMDFANRESDQVHALTSLRRHWDNELRNAFSTANEKIGQIERHIANLSNSALEQSNAWVEFMNRVTQEFFDSTNEHRAEMRKIRDEYMEEMRLRAASKYWEIKEGQHAQAVWYWLGGFGLFVFVMLMALFGLGPIYLKALPRNTLGDIGLSGLAALTLPSLMILWTMRHLSRMFVTHFHQREDARQRRALVTTYLALRHKGAATDGERLLILHALFRPNATKEDDDPGAQSLVDALAKQFSGGRTPL